MYVTKSAVFKKKKLSGKECRTEIRATESDKIVQINLHFFFLFFPLIIFFFHSFWNASARTRND